LDLLQKEYLGNSVSLADTLRQECQRVVLRCPAVRLAFLQGCGGYHEPAPGDKAGASLPLAVERMRNINIVFSGEELRCLMLQGVLIGAAWTQRARRG
jgi:hypothetical protein